jgi:hypothetical protein
VRTTGEVPDLLRVEVPIGGRILVSADLRLTADATPAQTAAVGELSQAIEAWSGPGVLVFNGNLTAQAEELDKVLTAHPRLVDAIRAFAAGPGRRVVMLPGDRDASLAWASPNTAGPAEPHLQTPRDTVGQRCSAEVALALELAIETGAGLRQVRVEPGHRFDPLAAFVDPRNPGESPLSQHLRQQVVPSVLARGATDPSRGRFLVPVGPQMAAAAVPTPS